MSERTAAQTRSSRHLLIGISIIFVVCVLALAACAPQANNAAASDKPAAEQSDAQDTGGPAIVSDVTMMNDFTDRNTGLYPDEMMSSTFTNAGNRGCNSCHADLWELTYTLEPTHIVTHTGYDKKGDILACLSCHSFQVGRTGNYFGDLIHTAHYSSDSFVDNSGNCWSCHSMVSSAPGAYNDGNGNYNIKLFEQVKYTDALGGYFDGNNEHTRGWVNSRGWSTEYLSGVTTTNDLNADVAISQPVSEEKDAYIVENWGPVKDMADWDSWTLDVQGVNNPQKLTLADLQAMPQTETTATQTCSVNGVNGSLVSNIPIKGVLLADLIDACGGLADGANQMYPVGVDGWTGEGFEGISVESMIERGAIVALEYYGHELTYEQGYPATIAVPGYGGSTWCKNLVSLTFEKQDQAFDPIKEALAFAEGGVLTVNSCWFDNDGVSATAGQPVTLKGFTWAWGGVHDGGLDSIRFSADYGLTWQTIAIPESNDPDQWTYWEFTWTPEKAGTYILHVNGLARDGAEQFKDASVIVKVTE